MVVFAQIYTYPWINCKPWRNGSCGFKITWGDIWEMSTDYTLVIVYQMGYQIQKITEPNDCRMLHKIFRKKRKRREAGTKRNSFFFLCTVNGLASYLPSLFCRSCCRHIPRSPVPLMLLSLAEILIEPITPGEFFPPLDHMKTVEKQGIAAV